MGSDGRVDLEAVRLFLQAGRYAEAEAALDRDPRPEDPEWLRLKGWARWHLGEEAGLALVERAARRAREGAGWVWQDLGALLFRAGRWREAEEALKRALDHFLAEEDHLGRAWALHGLGVAALHRGELGWALRRAEEAWALVRAKALGSFRNRVLVLLSSVHRARGELREALFRARQAAEGRLDPDDRAVALRALGTALRLSGRPAQGRERLEEALRASGEGARRGAALAELAACHLSLGWRREARRTAGEALGLLDTHAPARARLLVVLAELARREEPGEGSGSLGLLEEALAIGPYPLMEEALAFPDLFALAEARGLRLPRTRRAPERPKVRLEERERRLWVGRREVPLEGSGKAFDLLLLLATQGPTTWREAALKLWGEDGPGVRERLHTTASRARDLLADREAVRWEGEVLRLDSRRRWEVL
ncbi:tetratricopeptide repeat protein [Thermus tengchongensis]|uniref:tetratricopeptide repeat protein n=1 Tax=Thermus tengchongensis TaxID=1214928 RepID=UPI00056F7065|nr:tetratricopeptide repeat protein [Thermus tengchongensis]